MKYIDYRNIKEFCTIAEVCHLFEMDKNELRYYSEKYGISPQEVCARGAGIVQHPDALTQLHVGAVHAAVRCPPSPLTFLSKLLSTAVPCTQRNSPVSSCYQNTACRHCNSMRRVNSLLTINESLPTGKIGQEWRVLSAGIKTAV